MDQVDEAAVRAALTRPGMLRAHFQPIVDLVRGVVTGYEALARFAGPPRASPDRWFAAAAAAGVGAELEARALVTALASRPALPPNCFLTVNLGPPALLAAPVRDVLDAAGDLRGLVIEITEQAPVDDYDALKAALVPCRERGALVAVDDAGAGYASLHHIAQLEPALIKIDRGLVTDVDTDPVRAAVVEMLGLFASRIDAWVLAEGVETASELDRLVSLGVPLAQGWCLGRPSPAMGDATPEALALCRHRAARARQGELDALAESAVSVGPDAGEDELAAAFARRPDVRWLAVLDEFDRPVALVSRGPGSSARRRVTPLCVQAGERLPDLVRRLTTRRVGDAEAPLALCDARGRLTGLVPIARLLERVAALADAA